MGAPLFIDPRAGSEKLLPYFPDAEPVIMEFGDVMIVGNGPPDCPSPTIGIEVKSIHDLIQSIENGRFSSGVDGQVPGLLRDFDIPYLAYFGDYRRGELGALQVHSRKGWSSYRIGSRVVPFGYLESFLFDCSALGIRIRHDHDLEACANWIAAAYRWWSKQWHEHKGLRQFDRSRNVSLLPNMDSRTYIRAKVAAQLPGIGFEKALTIANYFPSVRDMANAGVQEWMEVDGIGRVIATTIVDVMEG